MRAAARRLLDSLDAEVVASRVRVERHQVEATIVVIGTRAQAVKLERTLDTELAEVSGVVPRVEVRAVPDAAAAAAVEPLLSLAPAAAAPLREPFEARIHGVRADVMEALSSRWPALRLGDLLAVDVDATTADLRITASHVGATVDGTALDILERVLEDALGMPVTVLDAALPAEPLVVDDSVASIALVAALAERSRRLESVSLCVYAPERAAEPEPPTEPGAVRPTEASIEIPVSAPRPPMDLAALEAVFARHPRVIRIRADEHAVAFAAGQCPTRAAKSTPE